MKAHSPTRILTACFLLFFTSISAQQVRAVALDSVALNIEGLYPVTYCVDQSSAQDIPAPRIVGQGQEVVLLAHADTYFSMEAAEGGWNSYFTPDRWAIAHQVAGAVDALYLCDTWDSDAQSMFVNMAPEGYTELSILIPVDGYVSFDWAHAAAPSQLSLSVNGQQDYDAGNTTGRYMSNLLRAGDKLSIRLRSSSAAYTATELRKFRFLTNAMGFIQRRWALAHEVGPGYIDQIIAIERPTVADIYFPGDVDFSHFGVVPREEAFSPKFTGQPLIDRDGDLSTASDQYALDRNTCAYSLSCTDERINFHGTISVLRHWVVIDNAAGNILKNTQLIKLYPASLETSTMEAPAPMIKKMPLPDTTQQRQLGLKADSDL